VPDILFEFWGGGGHPGEFRAPSPETFRRAAVRHLENLPGAPAPFPASWTPEPPKSAAACRMRRPESMGDRMAASSVYGSTTLEWHSKEYVTPFRRLRSGAGMMWRPTKRRNWIVTAPHHRLIGKRFGRREGLCV